MRISQQQMLPSQSYSSETQAKSVKQTFNSLVDAMLYVRRTKELEEKMDEAKELADKKLIALENFKIDVSDSITKLKDILGESHTDDLSRQITNFSNAAVDQLKKKLNQEAQTELVKLDSDRNSERTKAAKSIEAFLASSPFPLIDRSIEVKLQDGAYSAKARYRCQEDIEYEFFLDTKTNPFFNTQCRFGALDKSLRVPVALGKSWLKKQPVPDFRSLEQFVITSAEATGTSLVVESIDQDGDSQVKIVYTRHGDHASFALFHIRGGVTTEITSEPGLNIHLDSDSFVRVMERIWLALNDLEARKTSLSKITCNDRSLLENLDYSEFFMKSWDAIADSVKERLKASREKQTSYAESLTLTFVKEKLKSLGPEEPLIANALGIDH